MDKDIEIEIITDEDDTLKTLGELLANKTSRDLMKFLMSKSAYKKKISDELGVPFSLVEHHLKKLEKLGLVKITNKKLIKGGVLHKTYKITADGIFLMLNTTKKEIDEKRTLKKIFKEGIKFASIGIIAGFVWMSDIINLGNTKKVYPVPFGESVQQDPIVLALIIVIIGLSVQLIFSYKKKKKRG